MPQNYEGFYARFNTFSVEDYPILSGADTLVGDEFKVSFEIANDKTRAVITNRFDYRIGYFGSADTRKLQLIVARDWKMHCQLSFVAFTDEGESSYWGEMCIISYSPGIADQFDVFSQNVADMLAKGIRPDVALSQQGVDEVISSNGSWMPTGRVPLPETRKGMALVKSRRKASENLIERGREGNKGCYAVSIAFIVVVLVLVVWLILHVLGIV